MRNKVTVIAMTALLASSAAIGATVGILGASPDHQRELGVAIVVGARSGATNPPATETATEAGAVDTAGQQPEGDGLVAPGASWSVALDEVVAQREAEAEAARIAAERAAAERAKVTAVKKVVQKPVYGDDDDDDWDDDDWDDDEWDD